MARTNGLYHAMVAVLTLVALHFAALPMDAYSPDNLPPIADVVIVGNRKIPTDKIMQFIQTKPGVAYSDATARDDVTRLAASRLFKRIMPVRTEVEDGRLRVFFEVQEHPNIVREVAYKHVKGLDVSKLEELTRIKLGAPLDCCLNKNACYEIQEHLKQQGHCFAAVSLLEGDDEGHDRVIFDISAGPKVRVHEVAFDGHSEWTTADDLAGLISTRQAWIRTWGAPFRPAAIDADTDVLLKYLRDNGFFDAKVAYELCWRRDFRFVDVTFQITEGKRYRVSDFSVEGNGKLPRAKLAQLIKLTKGDVCSSAAIKADERRLADWGGRKGKRLSVKSATCADPDRPGFAVVRFIVDDAPVDRVGEIIIVGNCVTRDDVIRREITLQPGQVLDYTQLPIIEKKLRERGLFRVDPDEGVYPSVKVLDTPGKFKDILVKIEETRTGSLMVGFGVDSDFSPVFRFVLEERNFDPERWPTSWADLEDGRAFRGAGKHIRLEFGRTSMLPRELEWLAPFLP